MNDRVLWKRGRLGLLTVLLMFGAALLLASCMRAAVLPVADKGTVLPLSEPRAVDHIQVPLEKDPTKIYRIGPRDVIRIDVRKDPTLGQAYVVSEEGNIFMPVIGPFAISGMTTTEVANKLNSVLSQYIRQPDTKVGVQEYRSKVVYVVGQVNRPGPLVMRADMLTIQEAVFLAGLHTTRAALQRTKVISPAMEKPIVRQIDLNEVIYKGKMVNNMLLKPNDIVYIPARYSFNLAAAIRELLTPAEQIAYLTYGGNGGNGNGGGGFLGLNNNNNNNN